MFFPNPFGLECFVFLELQQHVPAESCLFRPITIFLDTGYLSLRSKCIHCFSIITMSSPTQWDVVPNSRGTGTEHQPTLISADCDTRRRMARERRGAGSSLVSMETQFYKQYMKDVL